MMPRTHEDPEAHDRDTLPARLFLASILASPIVVPLLALLIVGAFG
jgi:hypothetical protein